MTSSSPRSIDMTRKVDFCPPSGQQRLLLGNRHARDHLLLIVLLIGTVVKSAHRGCVLLDRGRCVAKVVADKGSAAANTTRVRRVQLRIPRVLRQPDVVPDRLQGAGVKLDRRIYAVISPAVGH